MSGVSLPRPSLAILDVGHGSSAVLADVNGVVVIDTGPGTALLEYLRKVEIDRLDVVLLSHADNDHIGGMTQLLAAKTVTVGRVRVNTDSVKHSDIWDDLLYELDQADADGSIDFGISLAKNTGEDFSQGDVDVEVIAPSKYLAGRGPGNTDRQGRKLTTNSISAVVRILVNEEPVALLLGDIDEIALDDLLSSEPDLSVPVLVFPHHGGRMGGGDLRAVATKLCKAVSPQTVIFSIGRGQHRTPQPEIIEAVLAEVPEIWIACTQLSQRCASDLPAEEPVHLAPVFSRGHANRQCCCGTILIALDALPVRTLPEKLTHHEFLRRCVPSALCRQRSSIATETKNAGGVAS